MAKTINKNLKALVERKYKEVDIGIVNNQYHFANAFGVGFDGEVATRVGKFSFIPNGFTKSMKASIFDGSPSIWMTADFGVISVILHLYISA